MGLFGLQYVWKEGCIMDIHTKPEILTSSTKHFSPKSTWTAGWTQLLEEAANWRRYMASGWTWGKQRTPSLLALGLHICLEKWMENELMALKTLLLISAKSPYKINSAPCSGIMCLFFPSSELYFFNKKSCFIQGSERRKGWGLSFKRGNDSDVIPSLDTLILRSKCLCAV